MDQSTMPACERCGTADRHRTRNRLPDGTRLVLCSRCVRKERRKARRSTGEVL